MRRFLADSPHFWIKTSGRRAACGELCLQIDSTIDIAQFSKKNVELPSSGENLRILTVLQMNIISAHAYLVAIVQLSQAVENPLAATRAQMHESLATLQLRNPPSIISAHVQANQRTPTFASSCGSCPLPGRTSRAGVFKECRCRCSQLHYRAQSNQSVPKA